MARGGNVRVAFSGDASPLQRETAKAERSLDKFERDTSKSLDRSSSKVRGFATISSGGFKRVGVAATGMAAAGVGAAALLTKSFVSGATDINESLSKNQVLFGKHADGIARWSKRTAGDLGISRQAALEATGTFGNLFVALDIGPRKSAGMSKSLVKLAADLASFNNASPEEAMEAIRSGLVGETEPLRRFGVNLNDATLRAEALRMGLVKNTKEALDPQTKALAVNALLFKQTEKAQGDFARTSGGLANQQRILKARLSDAGAELGGKLMPAALAAVKAVNSLFDSSSQGGRAIAAVGRAAGTAAGVLKEAWSDATRAVGRWVDRNRDTLRTLVQAMRNVGVAAQYVFEKVLLPVIRAAISAVVPIVKNLVGTLGDLVRFVANVLTGRWRNAWGDVKEIVGDAIRHIRLTIEGAAKVLWTVTKALGGQIIKGIVAGLAGLAGAIKNAVVSGVKKGLSAAGGSVGDAAKGLGSIITSPLGDGIGKAARRVGQSMGAPGLGGGALAGADPDLAPFAGVGARFGLRVSSGIRPGAVTTSGNQSYHATGDAVDMSGPAGGMMSTFRYLKKNFGSRLRELIYTPGGVGIKDGRPFRYTGAVAADHYDHVHVAYTGPFGDGTGRIARTGDGVGSPVSNARTVVRVGRKVGASMKQILAALATILVEAGGKNLPYGDRDSEGAFQQRPSQGWGPASESLATDARQFFRAISRVDQSLSVGGMAQAVQRSGFPARYDQRLGDARALLKAAGSTGAGGTGVFKVPRGVVEGVSVGGGGMAGSFRGGLGAGPQVEAGMLAVRRAKAEKKDDLAGLIGVMQDERMVKRRRLKVIRRALRTRMSRKRRARLLEEEATLIGEVGVLSEGIKEYKADQAGGATTISRAEELDAGVDTSAADSGTGAGTGGTGSTESDQVTQQLAALIAEQVANQKKILALAAQGDQIKAAFVAWINGDIGTRASSSWMTPGIAGQTANY